MEFGPNGVVIGEGRTTAPAQIERVKLGVFLSGLTASAAVALAGVLGIFLVALAGRVGLPAGEALYDAPFWQGVFTAFGLSALNWILFFFTVPSAWLGLGLALGRLPHNRVTKPGPYFKRGALAGAIVVCLFTGVFGLAAAGPSDLADIGNDAAFVPPIAQILGGAVIGGLITGALGGAASAGVFRLVVRPAAQIKTFAVDVF